MTDNTSEPTTAHHVHMDTLEYTRQGLRTREPVPLNVSMHNQVVLVRPDRGAPFEAGARGFPHDSSFPLLATLSTVWSLAKPGAAFTHHQAQAPVRTAYQVFGHTSASGDEAYNKALSERRAEVGAALLRSDATGLRAVANEEGWGALEYQSMLRTLGCDPGATDGVVGEHTAAAVKVFSGRYVDSVFHRRHDADPSVMLEPADGFDEDTVAALFDAFVHAHGAALSQGELHPAHPVHGCSEFNALSTEDPANNRRLSIIGHAALPQHHEHAPCRLGDAAACAVVDDEPHRCMFYREHVAERPPRAVRFADPRWFWLGEDRYLLSALTDLDEEAEVLFDVFDAPDRVRSGTDVGGAWVETPAAESLRGVIRRGVAQVVWRSGVTPAAADGRPALEAFPTFRVRDPASGVHSFAPWPESGTLRVLVGAVLRPVLDVLYRLRAGDGSYDQSVLLSDASVAFGTHLAVEFEDVPLDARVSLLVGPPGTPGLRVLDNVMADRLPGNCEAGASCRDVRAPVPPPDPSEPEEIDDDEDLANPWLELDPQEYIPPSYT